MGSLGKGTVATCIVALVTAAVWTTISYFSEWRLGVLALVVGSAAGAAMAGGSGRQGRWQGGLIAAIIAFVAMVGSRYALTRLELADWSARIADTSDEDVISAIADRFYDEAALDGSLETMYAPDDEDGYPPQIWTRAEATWSGMTDVERNELRDAMIAQNEASMAEAAPILTGIGMLLNIGFMGLVCMLIGVGTAFRLGSLGPEVASGTESIVGAPIGRTAVSPVENAPDEVLGGPLRAAMKLPVDPLEGTEAGSRSLIASQDPPLRKAA